VIALKNRFILIRQSTKRRNSFSPGSLLGNANHCQHRGHIRCHTANVCTTLFLA
jgi:hypothetical protein